MQEDERQRRLRERARALIAEARASQDLPEMPQKQNSVESSRSSSVEPGKTKGHLILYK